MKRTLLALTLAPALLAGCAAPGGQHDDGYQIGDLTTGVLAMQAEYCTTADPQRRALRVAALRAAGVPIPPSGACTSILALVPSDELDIDLEQAQRDQQRARDQQQEAQQATEEPAP
ncbi:MAG: hypothetical protein ACQEXI_00395 [Pseudomonadota bacterium]